MSVACECHSQKKKKLRSQRPMCAIDQGALRCPCRCEIHYGSAVKKEISGPGKLLGYRAMHKKIREIQGLQVPRDLVYAVMTKVDPDGLEERGGVRETKRPCRDKAFVSGVSTSANKNVRYKILYFSLF